MDFHRGREVEEMSINVCVHLSLADEEKETMDHMFFFYFSVLSVVICMIV